MPSRSLSSSPDDRLRELLTEAAAAGAREALHALGLSDEAAAADLRELRTLLGGWRLVKRGALAQFGKLLAAAVLGGLMALAGLHVPGFLK
jgi:hypothetical protein